MKKRIAARCLLWLTSMSSSACTDSCQQDTTTIAAQMVMRLLPDESKAAPSKAPSARPTELSQTPQPPQPLAAGPARSSTVTGGPASVQGELPANKVSEIIARHHGELRFCHASQTAVSDDIQLQLKLSVSPSGSVQRAEVSGAGAYDSRFNQCVTDAARRWTFPAPHPARSSVIEYPLRFASSSGSLKPQ